MASIFDTPDTDQSRVMTGAEFKVEFPLDGITTAGIPIVDGDNVRVSRIVRAAEFRGSFPPTIFTQGDYKGGNVYLLYQPDAHWNWMHDSDDVFGGTNVDPDDNIRQAWSSTGVIVAVLIGATDLPGVTARMAIA